MPDTGRWQLTDFQRLLMILVVVSALFLGAMAWGWERPELALVALFLVVGAGLAVFMLGLRYNGRGMVPGTAEVIWASPPPTHGGMARCDLRLAVDLPGRGRKTVKLRPEVDATRWPRAGMVLPVEVSPRGQVRVRWRHPDVRRVQPVPTYEPAPEFDAPGYNRPFFMDYADGPPAGDGSGAPTSEAPMSGAVVPDEALPTDPLDVTDVPPTTGSRAVELYLQPARIYHTDRLDTRVVDSTLVDSDTLVDTDPLAEPDLREADLREPDLPAAEPDRSGAEPDLPAAEPDRSGAEPDGLETEADLRESREGEESAQAAGFEVPSSGGGPLPRRVPRQPGAHRAEEPPTGMGVMLVVSNMDASVAFYRDTLGLRVRGQTPENAMLTFPGGRIHLQLHQGMPKVEKPRAHVQIPVADVNTTYRWLLARGVAFRRAPRLERIAPDLDVLTVTLEDPDGHAVQLVQDKA